MGTSSQYIQSEIRVSRTRTRPLVHWLGLIISVAFLWRGELVELLPYVYRSRTDNQLSLFLTRSNYIAIQHSAFSRNKAMSWLFSLSVFTPQHRQRTQMNFSTRSIVTGGVIVIFTDFFFRRVRWTHAHTHWERRVETTHDEEREDRLVETTATMITCSQKCSKTFTSLSLSLSLPAKNRESDREKRRKKTGYYHIYLPLLKRDRKSSENFSARSSLFFPSSSFSSSTSTRNHQPYNHRRANNIHCVGSIKDSLQHNYHRHLRRRRHEHLSMFTLGLSIAKAFCVVVLCMSSLNQVFHQQRWKLSLSGRTTKPITQLSQTGLFSSEQLTSHCWHSTRFLSVLMSIWKSRSCNNDDEDHSKRASCSVDLSWLEKRSCYLVFLSLFSKCPVSSAIDVTSDTSLSRRLFFSFPSLIYINERLAFFIGGLSRVA